MKILVFFMPSEHENNDIYVKVNGEEIPLKEYEKRQNNTQFTEQT